MAEIDLLLVVLPIAISMIGLAGTLLLYAKKADLDAVHRINDQFADIQRRLSFLEGRQQERDSKDAIHRR